MDVVLTVDAVSAPLTGIGRYAVALANGLRLHPAVERLSLFGAMGFHGNVADVMRANRTVATVRRATPLKYAALRAYVGVRGWVYRLKSRAHAGSVLHCPNYLALPHDGPVVVTVHDLSWVHFPRFHPSERVRLLDRLLPRSLARADRIVTDSEFVRREIVERYGCAPAKVVSVPLGVDPGYRPEAAAGSEGTARRLRLQDVDYILSVGTLEPRKNVARLIEAYAALPREFRDRHPLCIAGPRGWGDDDNGPRARALARAGHLRWLGYVPEHELPGLYARAHALAFVPIYEGFGLPALEAMACGRPTLCSTASALPEVVGDAALGVDPLDVDAIAAGLLRICEDDLLRDELAQRSLARAGSFTWERCVDRTVAVYKEVSA